MRRKVALFFMVTFCSITSVYCLTQEERNILTAKMQEYDEKWGDAETAHIEQMLQRPIVSYSRVYPKGRVKIVMVGGKLLFNDEDIFGAFGDKVTGNGSAIIKGNTAPVNFSPSVDKHVENNATTNVTQDNKKVVFPTTLALQLGIGSGTLVFLYQLVRWVKGLMKKS